MNQQDLNALTDAWHSDTGWMNDKIDEYFKSAQDHAYQLGLARGRLEAAQHPAPAPGPLTDEQIVRLFAEVNDSGDGWPVTFARAIERAALAQQGTGSVVAWGLFAKVGGEWVLQHPVRFSESDAQYDKRHYRPETELMVTPLRAAIATKGGE